MKYLLVLFILAISIKAYCQTVGPLIELATKIASVVDQKEKTKYADRILEIKKELADEELKTIPDDGRISYLHNELMRIYNVLGNSVSPKQIRFSENDFLYWNTCKKEKSIWGKLTSKENCAEYFEEKFTKEDFKKLKDANFRCMSIDSE